jgi:hypothetical protein
VIFDRSGSATPPERACWISSLSAALDWVKTA